MRWALIEGGKIANVVVQDSRPLIPGQWVQCGDAGPGWSFDGAKFTAPESSQQPPQPVNRWLSVGSFFDRFGAAKWSILADQSPAVQAVVRDASVRRYIDLDNPQLPGGLAVLISAGHAIDAAQIISAPVRDDERP
jgi:hypothetical protein